MPEVHSRTVNFKDWELLAVNDHSSDNSENIVRGYASKDNRIKLNSIH